MQKVVMPAIGIKVLGVKHIYVDNLYGHAYVVTDRVRSIHRFTRGFRFGAIPASREQLARRRDVWYQLPDVGRDRSSPENELRSAKPTDRFRAMRRDG